MTLLFSTVVLVRPAFLAKIVVQGVRTSPDDAKPRLASLDKFSVGRVDGLGFIPIRIQPTKSVNDKNVKPVLEQNTSALKAISIQEQRALMIKKWSFKRNKFCDVFTGINGRCSHNAATITLLSGK
jgi:hypothetical protein